MTETTTTMSGYEIRLELLKMAQKMAVEEYHMKRELVLAEYFNLLGSDKQIEMPEDVPEFPNSDTILNLADKLNAFVAQRVRH